MTTVTNYYHCPLCETEWADTWNCACNDRCPECDAEIEPYCSDYLDPDEPENYKYRARVFAPRMYDLLRELEAWYRDPDQYSGDMADIAVKATELLKEIHQ